MHHYANGGDVKKEADFFLDKIKKFIGKGIKPFIYIQKASMDRVKSAGYPLWIAQYADNNDTGFQKTPWNEGSCDCAIRQYSSHGRLNGYNGLIIT